MNYKEFTEVICKLIQNRMEDCNVQIEEVLKNNGVHLLGICINEPHTNVAPNIYLEEYYQSYCDGNTIDEIVEHICEQYTHCRSKKIEAIDKLMDIEYMRSLIVYKLINYEANVEWLQNVPYVPYKDLAIVFYCMLDKGEEKNVTVSITNRHMECWKMDAKELYDIAHENTKNLLPATLYSMDTLIEEIIQANRQEEDADVTVSLENKENAMYVLTNSQKYLGAGCILYNGILQDVSKALGSDYYILPSSIHEVILLPNDGMDRAKELLDMVHEVNETQVEPEEVLSNHIYYFSCKDATLHML